MKPRTDIPKATLACILLALVLVAYAGLRVLNLSQVAPKVRVTVDTASYVRISQESLFGSRFLAGSRPFVFPLVLKLLGNDDETVVWLQGIISIISWSVLAISAAYSFRVLFLKFTAFGLILLFSLSRYILGWDSVLLTESLSLSLMALFIAGWLWLAKGWHWGKAIFILTVAFLWTFSRDTNAWVVFLGALFLLLLVGFRLVDRKCLTLAGALIFMFFVSNLSADLGRRWVFPLQNILGSRILPNGQATDFLARCGMPVSSQLMELSGGFGNSAGREFHVDPALEEYRLWLYQNGKRCYVKWLLSEPVESIKAPLAEFNSLISMRAIKPSSFSKKFSPVLPRMLEAILFPRPGPLILLAIIWAGILIAIVTKAWLQNIIWWVVIGINILVLPHYLITWHGDAMGIYRHMISAGVQFYLGAWLFVLLVLDSLLPFKTPEEGSREPLFQKT